MIKVDSTDLVGLLDKMRKIPKDSTKAGAIALTRVAVIAKKDAQEEMTKSFDNPTKFVLNSIYVKPAQINDSTPQSEVGVKTNAEKYMHPHIDGGDRTRKGSERKLPNILYDQYKYFVAARDTPKNQFGNIPSSQINRVVKDLIGYEPTDKKKKKTKYFPIRNRKGRPMIVTKEAGQIKPVLIGVEDLHYNKTYDFESIVNKAYDRSLQSEYDKAYNQYVLKGK